MPRFISRESATPVYDYKESRMRFVDPTKLYRKSGGMGHPRLVARSAEGHQAPFSIALSRAEEPTKETLLAHRGF